MTSHTVTAPAVGTPEYALTPATVETVTFDTDAGKVQIFTDGAATLWYTLDGSTPAVDGPGSFYAPAAPSVIDAVDRDSTGSTVVKLISSGAPRVRVQRTPA